MKGIINKFGAIAILNDVDCLLLFLVCAGMVHLKMRQTAYLSVISVKYITKAWQYSHVPAGKRRPLLKMHTAMEQGGFNQNPSLVPVQWRILHYVLSNSQSKQINTNRLEEVDEALKSKYRRVMSILSVWVAPNAYYHPFIIYHGTGTCTCHCRWLCWSYWIFDLVLKLSLWVFSLFHLSKKLPFN